ncbi:hypothetical protein EV644_10941 [Kribbella orskensis]|uniref:Uncharacterized protein n=1 Tax=Kribbella orskensis TaxID=2512216 RepID=A0ABY2BHL1_9ACTN|nr:hypothetical protein EV642_109235 [Kribbella sp. VKM Ac-2500]TCO20022.1 hypothetical protein EV644_10941 [Kribbella orskensis]
MAARWAEQNGLAIAAEQLRPAYAVVTVARGND